MTNLPLSGFGTGSYDLHRLRRGAMNPYFARTNVESLVPTIQRKVENLLKRLEKFADGSLEGPMRLDIGFESLTLDVISHCCYGEDLGATGDFELASRMSDALALATKMNHVSRMFPFVQSTVNAMPESLVMCLVPGLQGVLSLQASVRDKVRNILNEKEKWASIQTEKKAKPTIFHQILTSKLPPQELSEKRLVQEGAMLIGAGFSTTARALLVTTFHLMRQPETLALLRQEISSTMDKSRPDLPPWADLEVLPFLTAVLKEGIRLSWGTSSRHPRVRHAPIVYKDYTIPPGTVISMSNQDVLMDPNIFAQPNDFRPSRWLEPNSNELNKYFIAFSKGSRACVGLSVAYAQMYLAIAAITDRYDLELFETDESAIVPTRDFFVPTPEPGCEGVKVLVKARQST